MDLRFNYNDDDDDDILCIHHYEIKSKSFNADNKVHINDNVPKKLSKKDKQLAEHQVAGLFTCKMEIFTCK
jgi:hypothetical protein